MVVQIGEHVGVMDAGGGAHVGQGETESGAGGHG